MAVVFIALLIAPILLNGVGMIANDSLRSVDLLADSWSQMEATAAEIEQTNIEVLSTATTSGGGGARVNITIGNSGQAPLLNFESWDVVARFKKTNGEDVLTWFSYTTSDPPGDNEWTVEGIYKDAATLDPEVFQPNILDPDEEMVIRVRVVPPPKKRVDHQVTIGTPNGVTVTTTFRED